MGNQCQPDGECLDKVLVNVGRLTPLARPRMSSTRLQQISFVVIGFCSFVCDRLLRQVCVQNKYIVPSSCGVL